MLIRILIVDHQRLVRQSLATMLRQDPDLRVVGEAADGHEAFTLALEKKPHIVLLDAQLPKLSAANTLRMLLGCSPDTRVLILAEDQDNPHVAIGLEAGAVGCILKDVDRHELTRIIKHYAQHVNPLASPFLTAAEVREPDARPAAAYLLTRREQEIVEMLARGLRSAELARALSISVETVKVHIQHIYRKMGVKNRVEMILHLQSGKPGADGEGISTPRE
ncbi:MAG: DNA-binding response regulator [Gammaproteobacteria bacterium]|nr:MAG: DNA-binding response regulator [Gammaproteobacteria bacterium]